jgi:hypothetical protein
MCNVACDKNQQSMRSIKKVSFARGGMRTSASRIAVYLYTSIIISLFAIALLIDRRHRAFVSRHINPYYAPPHIVINTCRRRIRVKRCWDITFVTGGLSVFRIKLALIKSSWGVWISPGLGWSISFTFSRPSLVPFSQSLLFENLKRNNLNKKECVPSISSVWICCCCFFFFFVVRFLTFEILERLRTLHLFAVMNIGTTIFPHLKFWNNSDFFLRFNPCSLVMPRSTCDECYINRAGRSEKSRCLNLIFYIFEKLAK